MPVSRTVRGDSPAIRGKVIHDRSHLGGGAAVAGSDFALGVGFGSTATIAVGAGSTDTKGSFTVTAGGTGLAQATATVTLTFVGGAFDAAPKGYARRNGGTAAGAVAANATTTTTTLVVTASTLPVTAETQIYEYLVIPASEPLT